MTNRLKTNLVWIYALLLLATSGYGMLRLDASERQWNPIQAKLAQAQAVIQSHEKNPKPDALQDFLDKKAASAAIQELNGQGGTSVLAWDASEPVPPQLKEGSTEFGIDAVTVTATAGRRWQWMLAATGAAPSLSSKVIGFVSRLMTEHPLLLTFLSLQVLALVALAAMRPENRQTRGQLPEAPVVPEPLMGNTSRAPLARRLSSAQLQSQLDVVQLENTALRAAVRAYADQLSATTAAVQKRRGDTQASFSSPGDY